MTIDIIHEGSLTKIIVKGIVKSIADSQLIKETVERISQGIKNILIVFADSFALTSSVIVYLIQKIHSEKIDLSLCIHNTQMYDLLNKLELVSLFNAKKCTY